MAYPLTQTLIDDFNRANGGIGAAYSTLAGGFNVSSNQIVGTGAGINLVWRNDVTPAADCEARIAVVTLPGSGQDARLMLRLNPTTVTGYLLIVYYTGSSFSWYLHRVVNGTPTQLNTTLTGQSMSAGDQIALQCVGNTIRAYQYTGGAWVLMVEVTDSNITGAGRVAIGSGNTTCRLDNFYGGGATQEILATARGVTLGSVAPLVSVEAGAVDASVIAPAGSVRLGSAEPAVSGATVVNGNVTAPPGAANARAARPVVSAPPVTSVKFGIIGDSDWDEYRADDNRGGTYAAITFSPDEMLVHVLGWDLGSWATRAEPRRTGYERNWARSRATVGTAFISGGTNAITVQGQHTGLAAQIAAGDVDAAVVWAGGNDIHLWNNTYADIYNGVVAGADLTTKINSILANMTTILDTIIAAGCQRIVVRNFYDPGPDIAGDFPNAAYRQRVTDAVATINAGIASLVAARAQCVLYDWANWRAWLLADYSYTSGVGFTILGEFIAESPISDEPHHMVLASAHFGTVFNGVVANSVIRALNTGFGLAIPTMTDAQIVGVINQSTDATVTAPAGAARSGGAAPSLSAVAAIAAVAGRAGSGNPAASVSSGAQIGAPAGSTRAGSAAVNASASAVALLPTAGAQSSASGAAVSAGAQAGVGAGAARAAGAGPSERAGVTINTPAGMAVAGSGAPVASAAASMAIEPGSAIAGMAGVAVSTGISAQIEAAPAAARVTAAGPAMGTTATIAVIPGRAGAGTGSAATSAGIAVTVSAAPGWCKADGADGAILAGASAIAPAGKASGGWSAAAVRGSAGADAAAGCAMANGEAAALTAGVLIGASAGSAMAGAEGADVSTGIAARVIGLPAGAMVGAAGGSILTGAVVAAPSGKSGAGAARATIGAGVSVIVAAGPGAGSAAGMVATVVANGQVSAPAGALGTGTSLAVVSGAGSVDAATGGALTGCAPVENNNDVLIAALVAMALGGSCAPGVTVIGNSIRLTGRGRALRGGPGTRSARLHAHGDREITVEVDER